MKKILVIGSLNMDLVTEVAHIPIVGETVLAKSLAFVPGGKGANQASAAGKLGGRVAMLGAVGEDDYGRKLTESLSGMGVDTSQLLRLPGVSTGLALIGVNDQGNNNIIVVQGANLEVTPGYLQEHLPLMKESDIVVLQLEIPLETVVWAAKKAKELGKTVILDPAPAIRDLPLELYPCLDVIKPNEVELGEVLGLPEAKEQLRDSCQKLLDRGAKNFIVTLGGEGAYLLKENGEERKFDADRTVKVVDTTSAGDSFTGALALGLAMEMDLEKAVELAMKVSNIVVTRKGAQTSIPSAEEVFGEKG